MEYTKEQRKYIDFFKKMAQGKIPHQSRFYCIDDCMPEYRDNQTGSAMSNITLVTPTQHQVEQAKMELKRNAVERLVPNNRTSKRKTQKKRSVKTAVKRRKVSTTVSKKRMSTKKRKLMKKKNTKRRGWGKV